MYYDALTTAAICDELNEKVLGGRIQKIIAPTDDSLAIEIYAHHRTLWLYASIHAQHARVHLREQKMQRMVETDSPLLLLLKKYVRGGRLRLIEQLPYERVLILTISKRLDENDDELSQAIECRLIIEIMGRYSNIVLVDEENTILDCAKRVYPQMNRYRVTLPHQRYIPPPPQDKLPPQQCSPINLETALRVMANEKPSWQALVEGFRAVSPLAAREIMFRATGSTETTVGNLAGDTRAVERTCEIVSDLFSSFDNHQWQPSLACEGDDVIAFAPYSLTHLPSQEAIESISAVIDIFYEQTESARPHQLARANLQKVIDQERDRLLRKKESLQRSLEKISEANRLRQSGEMILAYSSQIQRGQKVLEVDNLKIELDPFLTPSENAKVYFHEYAKTKAAQEGVPALLEETTTALDYLAQASTMLDLAEDSRTITAIRIELVEAGFGRGASRETSASASKMKKKVKIQQSKGNPKKLQRKTGPQPLRLKVDGLDILIGRSGKENDEATFELGTGNDLWLHARGVPGAHVIIKITTGDPTKSTIAKVASLAAYYSQSRNSGKVQVDYTRRRHVRKVKGGPPGLVTYTNEATLTVAPADAK